MSLYLNLYFVYMICPFNGHLPNPVHACTSTTGSDKQCDKRQSMRIVYFLDFLLFFLFNGWFVLKNILKKYSSFRSSLDRAYEWMSADMLWSRIQDDVFSVLNPDLSVIWLFGSSASSSCPANDERNRTSAMVNPQKAHPPSTYPCRKSPGTARPIPGARSFQFRCVQTRESSTLGHPAGP